MQAKGSGLLLDGNGLSGESTRLRVLERPENHSSACSMWRRDGHHRCVCCEAWQPTTPLSCERSPPTGTSLRSGNTPLPTFRSCSNPRPSTRSCNRLSASEQNTEPESQNFSEDCTIRGGQPQITRFTSREGRRLLQITLL